MTGAPECLAVVIPARGDSEGGPRKSLADVSGRPLLAHAVLAARASRRITRVVVSTDDVEIASVARRFGAGVVMRPAEISGDSASRESAAIHALSALEANEGYEPQLVMLIQCTFPLTTAEDLDGLVDTLHAQEADSAFLASPFHHFLWERASDGAARGINHVGKRGEDLAPQYLESGAAYVMRTALFREKQERFCGKVTLHPVDEERTLEVVSPIDLAKAEAAMRFLDRRHAAAKLPKPLTALVMDFDGVLTDNGVLVNQDGIESVRCDRGDGLGLGLLRERGIELLILSKEQNPVVQARARKLRIECLQGIDDKVTALRAWAERKGVALEQTIYVGNDVNDLGCMRLVGCAVAPADAHATAKAAAQLVLGAPGGRGAVRELCDLILVGPGDS